MIFLAIVFALILLVGGISLWDALKDWPKNES